MTADDSPSPEPVSAKPDGQASFGNTKRGHNDWRDAMLRREQQQRLARDRYPFNLFLLLVIVLLLIFWFYRHLQAYVGQSLLIGAPLTLWTLWKLLETWLPDNLRENRRSWASRILEMPTARSNLVIALVLAIGLLLTTSSIYFEHSGAAGVYTVEVWKVNANGEDELYIEPMTVSSVNRIQGRPFFLQFLPFREEVKLRFRIAKPIGFEEKSQVMHSCSRVHLLTPGVSPDGFDKKEYRALRLVPGKELMTKPPRVGSQPRVSVHRARITVDGKPYLVENLIFECVYVGGSDETVRSVFQAEDDDRRQEMLRNYLFGMNETLKKEYRRSPDELRFMSEILASSYRPEVMQEIEIRKGSKVTVELESLTDVGIKSIINRQLEFQEPNIQTVILGTD